MNFGAALAAALIVFAASAEADTVLVKRRPGDGEWTPRETQTLDDFPRLAAAAPDRRSAYGGWRSMRFRASGYFRTEQRDGVWWLVDPVGHAYLSIALNAVEPGVEARSDDPNLRRRFDGVFASIEQWAEAARAWNRGYGFNGLGSWSDYDAINAPGAQPIPYTIQLSLLSGYARSRQAALGEAYAYDANLLHVFEEGFGAYCAERMAALPASVRQDPYLIGYFSDNELKLRINVLDRFLALAPEDANRAYVTGWLARERGVSDAANVSDADRLAFYRHFINRYFATVAACVRAADPNHMILGSRFHGEEQWIRALFEEAGPYIDVISYNWYHVWNPDEQDEIDNWARWSGRPVIITEWYAKGEDSGLSNESGAGWLVRDQKARGMFYENFALDLLRNPNIVGFHWFRYRDNNPDAAALVDYSNRDSNKGFLDVDYQTYNPLAERARRVNERAYAIRAAFLREGS